MAGSLGGASGGVEASGGEEGGEASGAILRRAWGKMLRDVFGLDVEALRAAGRGLPQSRKVSREALAGLDFAQSLTVVAGIYELMGREGVIGSLPRVVAMLRGKVEARALVVREWSPLECRLLLQGKGWRGAMDEAARQEAQEAGVLVQGVGREDSGAGAGLPARAVEREDGRGAGLRTVADYKALVRSLCAPKP